MFNMLIMQNNNCICVFLQHWQCRLFGRWSRSNRIHPCWLFIFINCQRATSGYVLFLTYFSSPLILICILHLGFSIIMLSLLCLFVLCLEIYLWIPYLNVLFLKKKYNFTLNMCKCFVPVYIVVNIDRTNAK